jgi:hypothetical protein
VTYLYPAYELAAMHAALTRFAGWLEFLACHACHRALIQM